jgi:AcrR family transcriptional regulator
MAGAEADRRVRRTRRILLEAFITLVLERGYDGLTVQDVLDRADVGRSTFYAHYRDKEALLLSCFDGVRGDLAAAFAAGAPDPAAAVFAHAHLHRDVYKVLCGRRGGAVVQRHLAQMFRELVVEHMGARLVAARDLPADVVAEFYASATLGLLAWWVDHDFRYGPERITRMHHRLTAPALRAAADPDGGRG